MLFTKIKETFKDSLFPNICICGKWGKPVCDHCLRAVSKTKKDLCPICGKISSFGKTCSSCRSKSKLTGVIVFGKHEGVLKDLIWRYKYEFHKDLSRPLASLVWEKYSKFLLKKKFLVTFVPLSKERLNWRGYNQAEWIAREIGGLGEFEVLNLLKKEESRPQVGLSKRDRIKNMQDKVKLIDCKIKLNKNKILIIDDVFTTGATLEECAKILRKAGAREVWGLVLSRD